jgi:hypothetical protein
LPFKIFPGPETNFFSINIKIWIFYKPKRPIHRKKILASVNDKFTAGVIDIGGNLSPLSLTPAVQVGKFIAGVRS